MEALTLQKARRMIENQRRANRTYYEKNKDLVKQRSSAYWENHREAINARRRDRYHAVRALLKAKESEN